MADVEGGDVEMSRKLCGVFEGGFGWTGTDSFRGFNFGSCEVDRPEVPSTHSRASSHHDGADGISEDEG